MVRGTDVLFAATIASPVTQQTKNGEPQSSCFTLIGDHHCGILLGDVGQLVACIPTIHAVRGCSYRKDENCTLHPLWVLVTNSRIVNGYY